MVNKVSTMVFIALFVTVAVGCGNVSEEASDRYFLIQSKAILASMDYDFQIMPFPSVGEEGYGLSRVRGYEKAHKSLSKELSEKFNVDLRRVDGRFEAFDTKTGVSLNIYGKKDMKTVSALVTDLNKFLKTAGRVNCEFDGGNDHTLNPFPTLLFDTAYLKYQDERVGYKDGRYKLIEEGPSCIPLDLRRLLERNALARIVCYQFLLRTSSILSERYPFASPNSEQSHNDNQGRVSLWYRALNKYYSAVQTNWRKFLIEYGGISLAWSDTGFEVVKTETGDRVDYPRDNDLLNEALKELNFYKEKCDFVNYFQIENYPMFLLAILRLYDVNLELDKTTNKYLLADGPTDPKKFFEIVAEFTFVDSKDDIEYLKRNLKSW